MLSSDQNKLETLRAKYYREIRHLSNWDGPVGEIAGLARLVGNRVRNLPVDHRLIHLLPVEVGPD